MPIIGLGTDIVECARLRRMIERHGEMFLGRVFTDSETSYCQSRKRATEHFAGIWAAKQAVVRCLGAGGAKEISWKEIEVRNQSGDRPAVVLLGGIREIAIRQRIKEILISISHSRNYAIASAVAQAPDET